MKIKNAPVEKTIGRLCWRKIVTIPNKKLPSINIWPVYCSGCLKFKLLAIISRSKIQNPHVLNGRRRIQYVNCKQPWNEYVCRIYTYIINLYKPCISDKHGLHVYWRHKLSPLLKNIALRCFRNVQIVKFAWQAARPQLQGHAAQILVLYNSCTQLFGLGTSNYPWIFFKDFIFSLFTSSFSFTNYD